MSIKHLFVSGLLGSVIAACSDAPNREVSVEVLDENLDVPSWEEYRSAATLPGKVNGRTIYGVEWDIFTDSEQTLRAYYNELRSRPTDKLVAFEQTSTGFQPLFTGSAATAIEYCVSNSFASFAPFNKAQAVTDVQTAMRAWQAVANVRFVYVSSEDGSCTNSNANVDFAVVPSTHSAYIGCATNKLMWGSLGCPISGPFTASAAKGVLAMRYGAISAPETAAGVMMHELGHILGFRHEHPWRPGGCAAGGEQQSYPADDITGEQITSYDVNSVMHYPGICGKPSVDFSLSALDGQGSREAYGIPASWHPSVLTL